MEVLRSCSVSKTFRSASTLGRAPAFQAVSNVGFSLSQGETLGIVGESGCGKSTLARIMMGIECPSAGEILLRHGESLRPRAAIPKKALPAIIQMVFQDPLASLNPRQTALDLVAEPLRINTRLPAAERCKLARAWLDKVGLATGAHHRYPHQLSGGLRQRVAIARALVLTPKVLVCDEVVSALDASVQAQVLNLLMDLQDSLGLASVFISHDLAVVAHLADKVLVMRDGQVVESGPGQQVLADPQHPYTQSLVFAGK